MQIKLIAMDLDGTLCQHKQFLPKENKQALKKLSEKYKLLMVGAGSALRIFNQLEKFPIDVIGNYGMQYGEYDDSTGELIIKKDFHVDINKKVIEERINLLRTKFNFTNFKGESVEFHNSGCVTFPILGTKAELANKLSFDPDRKKRRAIYQEVVNAFPDYTTFIGGSSSFDFAPFPFNKKYALENYCKKQSIDFSEVVYIGDDYGQGGNDESVYLSDFSYIKIDDYRDFPKLISPLL